MGLIARISEQRRALIEGHAGPFLDDGEHVSHWVRARPVKGRGEGFVFVTDERLLIVWANKEQGHLSAAWDDIQNWALIRQARGGPILGIKTADEISVAQIRITTRGQAEAARELVRTLAGKAPPTDEPFEEHQDLGHWETNPTVRTSTEKRTLSDKAHRIVITVVGVALIVAAVVIIPLPGPWSFVLTLAGLAILAREYDWAKDLLVWVKHKFEDAKRSVSKRKRSKG